MNKKLLTPLFVATSFMLIGCSTDTIVARPHNWDKEKIIENAGDKDNKMKNIYDAVKALGDTNANVLTRVLYNIAQSHLGYYDKLPSGVTELTLEQIATTEESEISQLLESAEFKNFVDNHKIYQAGNKGVVLNNEGKAEEVDLQPTHKMKIAFNKIKQQYNLIKNDIAEKLYDEIKGGTYSTQYTKLFDEKKFVNHIEKELYDLGDKKVSSYYSDLTFFPKSKDVEWSTYITKYLHVFGDETIYKDYIERKILPDLYKTYLTQTYVKEQRYSSLGRSYARKVNMITVPYTNDNISNVSNLMSYFSHKYITNIDGGVIKNVDFDLITQALNGFVGTNSNDEKYMLLNKHIDNSGKEIDGNFTILNVLNSKSKYVNYTYTPKSLGPDDKSATPTHIFRGTKLGDLFENKILKCCNVITDDDGKITSITLKSNLKDEALTAYNDITSSGKYTLDLGIELKEREIRQTDLTKDGWFLKNGGLTDLNSTFRDRLFNIATSNQVDDTNRIKGTEGASKASDYIKYFGDTKEENLSNRKAFVTAEYSSAKDWDTIILNEKGKSYSIIQVVEAPNTSKLSDYNNNSSYLNKKAVKDDPTESTRISDEIVRDVVKANATGDTYKNNANQYYLMISNIIFYDQSVYDYFKSQFPDLFK